MPIHFNLKAGILSLIAGVWIVFFIYFNRWPEEFRGGDPFGYYVHLPATFIYHDVGDYRQSIAACHAVWGEGAGMEPLKTPIGRYADKYPMGVPVLLTPFFLLAHVFCLLTGWFPASGFSAPYALALGIGPMLYVLLGLWLLFDVLRRYFPAGATALVIVILGLGTNLFYFTAYNNLMAHAFLFALYAFLLYTIHRFEDAPGTGRAAWVGLALGLIVLTRLHAVIVVVVPLLWGVYSWSTLRTRVQFLRAHAKLLLTAALAFVLVILPQLVYYRYVSGQWIYYAYQGESFDFAHPRILDGLFHYSNGWLIYTPVMIFALIGLFRLRKTAAASAGPLYVFLPLHLYITYSWWCWNYINGLGSRPMVDTYPLLAFPLGAFLAWGQQRAWKRGLNWGLAAVFILLNLFQTWQLAEGLIWTEAGTRAHFWAMLGRPRSTVEALVAYDSNESQPVWTPSLVRNLLDNPMEDSTAAGATRELKHSGDYSVRITEGFAGTVATDPLPDVQPGDWIRASVWGYVRLPEHKIEREKMALLVLEIHNPDGAQIRYRSIRISSKIGNLDHSIWSTGDANQWGEAAFFVRVPQGFQPGGKVKAYVWDPGGQRMYVDDLRVDLYR